MTTDQFEVREHVESREWDMAVASLDGSIHHSSAFARYMLAANGNAVPRFICFNDDTGKPIGAALAFQERSRRRLLAPLTGRLWLAAVPIVRSEGGDGLLRFLRELEAYARRTGNTELDIHSSASFSGREELDTLGFALTDRFEFELDLTPSEDDLFKNMEHKRRKNVRKAARSGVVLEDLNDEEGIGHLRRLQGASSERIVARGGRDITYKGAKTADPVKSLLDSGVGRIVVAKVDDEVVSAGLFTHFNGLVYHTLSGHGEAALRTQAPTFLLWETIKRYKAEGAKRFNFGGCLATAVNKGDPENGIYVYKMGFGGERLSCSSGHKVLRKGRYCLVRCLKKVLAR